MSKLIIDLNMAIELAREHNKIAIEKLPNGVPSCMADLKSAEDYLGKEYPLTKKEVLCQIT